MAEQAFLKGAQQLRVCQLEEARRDLMEAVGVTTYSSYVAWERGQRDMTIKKKEAVEQVFSKYGIPASEVWGKGQDVFIALYPIKRKKKSAEGSEV